MKLRENGFGGVGEDELGVLENDGLDLGNGETMGFEEGDNGVGFFGCGESETESF